MRTQFSVDDGDVDLFVDMPTALLLETLIQDELLKPPPYIPAAGGDQPHAVHWTLGGSEQCGVVYHMTFSDMVTQLTTHPANMDACPDRLCPQLNDTCRCRLRNGAVLSCHKDAPTRMFAMYGPSWKIPLGVKQMVRSETAVTWLMIGS